MQVRPNCSAEEALNAAVDPDKAAFQHESTRAGVQIGDGELCEERRCSLTQWVARSLLSKKQCLIYGEIKAQVRRGSARWQQDGSAVMHTQLFSDFLFLGWVGVEGGGSK